MKLFDIMKRTDKLEKEAAERGDIRHVEVDERLRALEAEVVRLDALIKTKRDK